MLLEQLSHNSASKMEQLPLIHAHAPLPVIVIAPKSVQFPVDEKLAKLEPLKPRWTVPAAPMKRTTVRYLSKPKHCKIGTKRVCRKLVFLQ